MSYRCKLIVTPLSQPFFTTKSPTHASFARWQWFFHPAADPVRCSDNQLTKSRRYGDTSVEEIR
jgi:hypothetical protein